MLHAPYPYFSPFEINLKSKHFFLDLWFLIIIGIKQFVKASDCLQKSFCRQMTLSWLALRLLGIFLTFHLFGQYLKPSKQYLFEFYQFPRSLHWYLYYLQHLEYHQKYEYLEICWQQMLLHNYFSSPKIVNRYHEGIFQRLIILNLALLIVMGLFLIRFHTFCPNLTFFLHFLIKS